MRLFKRNTTWWLDVTINGQRYRLSLDTTDGREAKSRANSKIAEIDQGKVTPTSISFVKLGFDAAADKYLESRRLELQPSSYTKEKQLLSKLREFFAARQLSKINAEHLLAYREWRKGQGVGNTIINMEVGVFRRIFKRAKRWHLIAEDVKPLKQPGTIGRALSPEQKLRLLEVAARKPEWETAYWAAILALNTTMRACEIKALRWADVNLFALSITIPKSKTVAGERTIPLTAEAYKTLLKIRKRAEMFGYVEPSHYVFPALKSAAIFNGNDVVEAKFIVFDPIRPIGSWRKAWRNLTKQAGLAGLRFHDLRHHAITELAEAGVPEQTIMAIAGHVSRRMLDRYSHIRLEAKRAALEALSICGPTASTDDTASSSESYGTKCGTNSEALPVYSDLTFASIDKTEIGACGFEPQTPTVSR